MSVSGELIKRENTCRSKQWLGMRKSQFIISFMDSDRNGSLDSGADVCFYANGAFTGTRMERVSNKTRVLADIVKTSV